MKECLKSKILNNNKFQLNLVKPELNHVLNLEEKTNINVLEDLMGKENIKYDHFYSSGFHPSILYGSIMVHKPVID